MEAAAYKLSPLPAPKMSEKPLELHLFTGRRFWYQTAFCLWTFGRHAGRCLTPVIYDDGSLTEEWRAPLARIVPSTRFLGADELSARLNAYLPKERFPILRERYQNFFLIRKLIDVHVGQSGCKLFIDSDLLFFRKPQLLVDWLDHPTKPLHAIDIENAYGYSLALLSELVGRPVPERVNTGLCGLRSEDIDWERMEYWCKTLNDRAGTHYYQEQALVALLLAGRDCIVAPAASYVTFPQGDEVRDCSAVMHHYVSLSKRWYFRRNWKKALSGQFPS